MIINILSGDCMVEYSEQLGFKDKVIAFGESVITGRLTSEIFSPDFITARASSLGIHQDKYKKRFVQPLTKLRSTDDVHLWFGVDMFCQMNLICVLAILEKAGIEKATFHEVFEDEMIEKSVTQISTQGFSQAYEAVLVNHNAFVTNIDSVNSAQELYFEFINAENGPLCSFIRENSEDSVLTLSIKIIRSFAQYGLGDIQCKDLILRVRAQ